MISRNGFVCLVICQDLWNMILFVYWIDMLHLLIAEALLSVVCVNINASAMSMIVITFIYHSIWSK